MNTQINGDLQSGSTSRKQAKPEFARISDSRKYTAQMSSGTGTNCHTDDLNVKFDKEIRKHIFIQKRVTVFDVAAYILNKLGSISAMKLQKLVYYCQAWSLVWDERPLFSERIEAWTNGPVVPELFAFHRGQFIVDEIPIGNVDNLNSTQKETIDAVLDFYGDKPAQWLIDLAHSEKPWQNARKGLSETESGNREISIEAIADYYSSLS
jgi:uncharacterized phage-associated protein